MDKKLHILHLEDNKVDAEIIQARLLKEGLECDITLVVTREGFTNAIEQAKFDVILADYSLPTFNGHSALRIAQEKCPDVPFILVSGALGEEMAIEILNKGARDYVLKDNLKKLVPSVKRALKAEEEITERRRLQRILQESEKAYRLLAENSNDMITRHSPDGTYLYVSPACRTLFGYEPEDLIGTNAFEQMHPEDVKSIIEVTQDAVRKGGSHVAQYRHLTKDGQYIWVETVGKVIKNEETGSIDDIICVVRDITERNKAEERIKMLSSVVKQSTEGMAIAGLDGNLIFINEAWGRMHGYKSSNELLGKSLAIFHNQEQIEKEVKPFNKKVIELGAYSEEVGHITRDGKPFPTLMTSTVLKDEQGKPYALVGIAKDITDRKQAEKALKQSEERYRKQFEEAIDAIFLADLETGMIVDCNIAASKLLEKEKSEIIGKHQSFLHPDRDIKDGISKTFKSHMTGDPSELLEDRVITKSGQIKDVAIRASKIIIQGKEVMQGFFRDITELKRAENALEKLRHHNELILNSAAEGIIGLDTQGNHTFVNPLAAQMLGYAVDELIGRHSHTAFHYKKADGSLYPEDMCPIYATLKDGTVHNNIRDEVFWRKDGTSFIVSYSSNPIMDAGKIIGAVVNFRDITERTRMEEKLQYLAYYDSLTGLPNRTLFLDRVSQATARAEPSSRIVAVSIINIDRFKSINDTYGSEIGDNILKEIAGRLSTSVRKGDTIARLSNDEFGIALIDVAHPNDIVMVLEKIIKDISYPLKIAGDEIILSFSMGISLYPHDGVNTAELLKSAGLSLSIAKKEGGKTYQFYTKDMHVKAAERILLEKQLMRAINNEEFVLYYQPYWDMTTKKMVGMEALIRWQSKNTGLVPPGKFIPLLEDTRMIIDVGEWILREATRQVKRWQDKNYPVVPVSVNMSLVQFRQKNLAETVKKVMGECGFYPSLLTLEITESAFMQDIEFTRSVLTAMKEMGCSVSIDDFGTGYSSLAYLKRFPIDNLKIDISFIRAMVKDPDSASIVMAIINMAHTLNLKTIAEGVETEEQWNFLRLFRCDMGQGYYLSKPLPAEDIERFFEQQ